MRYDCYLSRKGRNGSWIPGIEADDEAEAAFNAWIKTGGHDRPMLRTEGNGHWFVDGNLFTVNAAG